MKAFLSVLLLTGLTAPAIPAAPAIAQEWPTIPEPVAVELDPATTAFLVLDINTASCRPRPPCVASLPAIASFLGRAREAGVPIVYANSTVPGATIVSEVAPQADEPVVIAPSDKFFGTDLQAILDARGTRTAVIVGTAANGAVLYTSFSATIRGYTVVVAEDGIAKRDRLRHIPHPLASAQPAGNQQS